MNAEKRVEILSRLRAENPNPKTELNYHSDFELLISVILSAQATDVSVNKATEKLYAVANTPEAIAALGLPKLKSYVKTIGLYNTKAAQHHQDLPDSLRRAYGSEVPRTREASGSTARRRQEDRQCRTQHRLWRTYHGSGYPHFSNLEPNAIRAWQKRPAGRKEAAEGHPGRIYPGLAPLADPPRAIYLHRQETQVRRLCHL